MARASRSRREGATRWSRSPPSTTSDVRRSTSSAERSCTSISSTSLRCSTPTISRPSSGPVSDGGSSSRCSSHTTCSGISTATGAGCRPDRTSHRCRPPATTRSTCAGDGSGPPAWRFCRPTGFWRFPSFTASCTCTATRCAAELRPRRWRMRWRSRSAKDERAGPGGAITRSRPATARGDADGGRCRRRCSVPSTRSCTGTRSAGGPPTPTTAPPTPRTPTAAPPAETNRQDDLAARNPASRSARMSSIDSRPTESPDSARLRKDSVSAAWPLEVASAPTSHI